MRLLLQAWILGALACGPSLRDAATSEIRGGMDPASAVDDALGSFEAEGFVLDVREEGPGFSAFGARHPDGRSVVRVASERGWVLAVTAPSVEHSRPWVRLLPGSLDVDRNAVRELLIAAPDAARGVTCASIVEVVDGGAVERHIDFAAMGGEGCVVGHSNDESPALVAHVFYPALSRGVVPQVAVVLRGGYRVESARGATRDAADPAARWAAAVEAAAREFVLGSDAASQRRAFDALADCAAVPVECAEVHSRIDRAWADDAAEVQDAPVERSGG